MISWRINIYFCAVSFVFFQSAINPYVVSILFRTDASVNRVIIVIPACSFVRRRCMESSLCFFSRLLKRCFFLCKVLFLCRVHLICNPTEILCFCLNLSIYLFFKRRWQCSLFWRFVYLNIFSFNRFCRWLLFNFSSYHRAVFSSAVLLC